MYVVVVEGVPEAWVSGTYSATRMRGHCPAAAVSLGAGGIKIRTFFETNLGRDKYKGTCHPLSKGRD